MAKPELWRKKLAYSNCSSIISCLRSGAMIRWCVYLTLVLGALFQMIVLVRNDEDNAPVVASLEDHKASLKYMGDHVKNTGWYIDTLCLIKHDKKKPLIVYGVGAGEDISWDIGMVEEYGASVVIIDPTAKAKAHVESVLATKSYSVPFLPQGLSAKAGEITFAMPANPDHVSMRSVELADGTMTRTVTAPVRTLRDFMKELQHDYLDVLKMDIEGAEYDVLESLLRDKYLPFTQLLVEYHDRFLTDKTRHENVLKGLEQAGFVELWSQNGGQERGYIKRNDLKYCAGDQSYKRSPSGGSKLRR